jgi:hypothetical protein
MQHMLHTGPRQALDVMLEQQAGDLASSIERAALTTMNLHRHIRRLMNITTGEPQRLETTRLYLGLAENFPEYSRDGADRLLWRHERREEDEHTRISRRQLIPAPPQVLVKNS